MRALVKLRDARELLLHADIGNPQNEAEEIIAHCLGMNRMNLFRDNPEIGEEVMQHIETYLQRRAHREPLQYVLGYTEFHGLIPRPETELLVEEAVGSIAKLEAHDSQLRFLDLCTGTGCIALALAKAFPGSAVYGTDTSETAIHYAEENARANGIQNVTFLKGSFFEPLAEKLASHLSCPAFELIISNPPYVRTAEIKYLQPEVKDWEPVDALNGGEDGLDYFKIIIPEAKKYLRSKGLVMFEMGMGQADAVQEIAKAAGYGHTTLRKDYAGIDRIITIWL
jgi:release factor glutamine methyltransferase